MTITDDTVLLLIDVQDGFDHPDHWGTRNNPHAEANMARLLGTWRTNKRPVIHVQHYSTDPNSPLHPSQPGSAIKELVAPWPGEGEPVITKHVNSAFIGTDLEDRLRAAGVTKLVLVGLTTMHCVSTTRAWRAISALIRLWSVTQLPPLTVPDPMGSIIRRS